MQTSSMGPVPATLGPPGPQCVCLSDAIAPMLMIVDHHHTIVNSDCPLASNRMI